MQKHSQRSSRPAPRDSSRTAAARRLTIERRQARNLKRSK